MYIQVDRNVYGMRINIFVTYYVCLFNTTHLTCKTSSFIRTYITYYIVRCHYYTICRVRAVTLFILRTYTLCLQCGLHKAFTNWFPWSSSFSRDHHHHHHMEQITTQHNNICSQTTWWFWPLSERKRTHRLCKFLIKTLKTFNNVIVMYSY